MGNTEEPREDERTDLQIYLHKNCKDVSHVIGEDVSECLMKKFAANGIYFLDQVKDLHLKDFKHIGIPLQIAQEILNYLNTTYVLRSLQDVGRADYGAILRRNGCHTEEDGKKLTYNVLFHAGIPVHHIGEVLDLFGAPKKFEVLFYHGSEDETGKELARLLNEEFREVGLVGDASIREHGTDPYELEKKVAASKVVCSYATSEEMLTTENRQFWLINLFAFKWNKPQMVIVGKNCIMDAWLQEYCKQLCEDYDLCSALGMKVKHVSAGIRHFWNLPRKVLMEEHLTFGKILSRDSLSRAIKKEVGKLHFKNGINHRESLNNHESKSPRFKYHGRECDIVSQGARAAAPLHFLVVGVFQLVLVIIVLDWTMLRLAW